MAANNMGMLKISTKVTICARHRTNFDSKEQKKNESLVFDHEPR